MRTFCLCQLLGKELASKIKIYAGDVVPKKKPDPAIYNLAAEELGVDASKCAPLVSPTSPRMYLIFHIRSHSKLCCQEENPS